MRTELGALVPLKLNAEKDGQAMAERYHVSGYPTMVFVTADGEEVDRIDGYLPPAEFLAEVRRIRRGDTFASSMRRMDTDPGSPETLRRVVQGLLDRSDYAGALARLDAHQAAAGTGAAPCCAALRLRAGAALQEDLYGKAARHYRSAWREDLDLPPAAAGLRLSGLVAGGLKQLDEQEQATKLREARHLDAGDLLRTLPQAELETDDLLPLGEFAFSSGHYAAAADLYRRWFTAGGGKAAAAELNAVAWNLYLSGQAPDLALAMARRSVDADSSPDSGDTLARLLYASGAASDAIAAEERAAAAAEGDQAEQLLATAASMRRGEKLGDAAPFETYPGKRRASAAQ